jgi:hypothetical protein
VAQGKPSAYAPRNVSTRWLSCDALIGRFRVEDLVREHLIAGGTLDEVTLGVTVDLLTPPQAPTGRTDLARVPANAPPRRVPTRPAA